MENKNKVLLLKDLCGRLPYGVKCENFNHVYGKNIFKVTDIRDNGYICGIINNQHCWAVFDTLELKPYLFPLSSMTEEQKEEYESLCIKKSEYTDLYDIIFAKDYYDTIESIDYLYKNHIDIRGLIPKGLAIDATGLNIYKEDSK